MSQPTRSVWGKVFRNFINSLKPRQISGTLAGTDYLGNKYYEIPENPSVGKNKRNRWFVPPDGDFQHEMPAEWEAWLRGRRKEAPPEEEVLKNLAIMEMKKRNAIEVEAKAGKKTPMKKGIETFPQLPDYEMIPGKKEGDPS